jgi:uncharacterized NAD(P)/FAD-binding protein YdhS
MQRRRPVVAIVGGGFSGCLVAVHMMRQTREALRIVLIDRDDVPGRGLAYRDQPDCHLLNVRASGMSAFPDQPDHFLDWLNAQYSPCNPVGADEFVPRRIYGAYIQSQLLRTAEEVRRGVSFETRTDEAVGIRTVAGNIELRLKSGARVVANACVLALGNPGPSDPPSQHGSLDSSPRYSNNAWSSPDLYTLKTDDDVLLVGSGLTALDWLAGLHGRRHRGRITVVSRRGLLPHVHRSAASYALSFPPQELPPRLTVILRTLRAEVRRCEAAGGDWRSVIDALRPHTQGLWRRLDAAEQRRFLRHLRPYWEIHRHRAAPRVAETVYELLRAGQLRVIAGRIHSVEERPDGLHFAIKARREAVLQAVCAQRAINCTGPESDYRRLNHALLTTLMRQGMVQPDALGLGLLCDEQGAMLDAKGVPSLQLFTLGPPRKGQLWETTAVPEIRVQAQALARTLLGRLADRSAA